MSAPALHARLEGPDGAPVLVLAHSLGTDLTLWDELVARLVPRWRVLRYDARGHGGSDAPPAPYTIHALAADLLGLLAQHRIARAHLVGVSLGALTVIAAALRDPTCVAGIVVSNTRTDVPAEFATAIKQRNRSIRANGMTSIIEGAPARWLAPGSRDALAERMRGMVRRVSAEGFIGCAEAVRTAGLHVRLPELRVPVLFVASEQDPGQPVEVMRAMQALTPGARFATIANAGHLSPLEQPEAFHDVLRDFLASG